MAGSVDILTLKNDIADQYIDQWRTELWIVKSDMILPIETKLKQIMVNNEDMGDSLQDVSHNDFRKNIIKVLGNDKADKLYTLIKEKKNELSQKNTKEELEALKLQISVINKDQDETKEYHGIRDASMVVVSWALPIAAVRSFEKWKQAKRFAEVIDVEVNKKMMNDLAQQFTLKAQNKNITPFMRKNYKETAKIFTDAGKTDQKAVAALDTWRMLKNKIPDAVINTMNITEDVSVALRWVSAEIFANIKSADTVAAAQEVLKKANITGLSDEAVEALRTADTLEEFKGMTEVFAEVKWFKALLKGLWSMIYLDILAMGIEVRSLTQSLSEGEKIKKINEIRGQFKKLSSKHFNFESMRDSSGLAYCYSRLPLIYKD